MSDTISTVEVLLRVGRADGNDAIEATTNLPIVPRKGDVLGIWCNDDNWLIKGEVHAEVVGVALCTWAPESVEVELRFDGYDMAVVKQIMAAVERNDQP